MNNGLKTLALSELRRVAERTERKMYDGRLQRHTQTNGQRRMMDDVSPQPSNIKHPSDIKHQTSNIVEVLERVPWRVWYVAASNGDMILGEECVTLAVELGGPGRFPSRLVQFTASGQTRRLRDCCILRADDFKLVV